MTFNYANSEAVSRAAVWIGTWYECHDLILNNDIKPARMELSIRDVSSNTKQGKYRLVQIIYDWEVSNAHDHSDVSDPHTSVVCILKHWQIDGWHMWDLIQIQWSLLKRLGPGPYQLDS